MNIRLQEQLQEVVGQIRTDRKPQQRDLIGCLCTDTMEDRCEVNRQLAEMFLEVSDLDRAAVCIQRAWMLSNFSPDILPLFLKINAARKDVAAVRQAHKQRGILDALSSNVDGALTNFNHWHYAAATYLRRDCYEYDFDILRHVDRLAMPYAMNPPRRALLQGEKIRLAYLVFGATHANSVLVKINRLMARYHDKERFDITFVVPEPREDVIGSPQGCEHLEYFISCGCKVLLAPERLSRKERLLQVAAQICASGADLLVTSALLADFEHYFIAATRPAPVIAGLLQGPPAQYAAPLLDWVLSWSPHPLMDSPCNGSLVPFEIELPERRNILATGRGELGLPEAGRILMSAGRAEKFQLPEYWRAVLDVLRERQDVWYLVVGADAGQLPFAEELQRLPEWGRVRMLGWRTDCLNIMCLADLLVDTFPSGGGHVLADAMALSVPIISFKNDYLQNFDQTEWSVVDCFADIPELLVERYDFPRMKETVFRLLDDAPFYRQMAEACRQQINLRHGSPAQGIRRCEDVYCNLLSL